jgi:hypothetical protein
VDVAELSTPDLESELVALAGHLAAAQRRFLLLLAEFNATETWAGPGLRSYAHWLSWRVGMGGQRAGAGRGVDRVAARWADVLVTLAEAARERGTAVVVPKTASRPPGAARPLTRPDPAAPTHRTNPGHSRLTRPADPFPGRPDQHGPRPVHRTA